MRIVLIFAYLVLGSGMPSYAFDHSDRTSLDAALQRYSADLEAERMQDVDRAIPPKIYAMFMERSGESETALRNRMVELERRILGDVDILDVRFDTEGLRIQSSAGNLDYAFLPTETVTSEGLGPDITSHSQTFALQEDGVWFFLRLRRTGDFALIQTAYPDFATIKPPPIKDTQ